MGNLGKFLLEKGKGLGRVGVATPGGVPGIPGCWDRNPGAPSQPQQFRDLPLKKTPKHQKPKKGIIPIPPSPPQRGAGDFPTPGALDGAELP